MKRVAVSVLMLAVLVVFSANGISTAAAQQPKNEEIITGKTVNINRATVEEFTTNVPLISSDLAKKVIKYRQDNGDFQTLEELLQVEGFSRDLLRRIKPFLILEGIGGDACTC
jgi:competence protein ComEA